MLVLSVLFALVLAGVLALVGLNHRRAAHRHREAVLGLGVARDQAASALTVLARLEPANDARVAGLPEHDDPALVSLREDHARARSLHEDAARCRRQVSVAHPLPEGPADREGETGVSARSAGPEAAMTRDRASAAVPAYTDLVDRSAAALAAAERVTSRVDDLEELIADIPARADRARAGADDVADLLEGLRAQGYRTSDYDHVPDAVRSQVERATDLGAELRVTDAVSMLEGVEHDVVEVRRRIAELDAERARIVGEIETVGARTPGIDEQLAVAYRELQGLEQQLAAGNTAGLRERLDEGAGARAAVPRLLRSATEESSVEVQQLVRARRRLEEATALCETAEREAAVVRERVAQLRSAAQELPVAADRTAARAQNLAELAQRHVQALAPWAAELDPHQQHREARSLGDQARATRPDLVDVATRLDDVRGRVAAGEARVESAVAAYAARQLSLGSARSAVAEAVRRSATPEDAVSDGDSARATALVGQASEELVAAESEVDHDAARDRAARAADLARRALHELQQATSHQGGPPGHLADGSAGR